jgi:hypothetical protein
MVEKKQAELHGGSSKLWRVCGNTTSVLLWIKLEKVFKIGGNTPDDKT